KADTNICNKGIDPADVCGFGIANYIIEGTIRRCRSSTALGKKTGTRFYPRPCFAGFFALLLVRHYGAIALRKFIPLGVPTAVVLSQPLLVVSEVFVPNVITNQRVENGLLYSAL